MKRIPLTAAWCIVLRFKPHNVKPGNIAFYPTHLRYLQVKIIIFAFLTFLIAGCGNRGVSPRQETDDHFIEDHPVEHLHTNYFGVTLDKYLPLGSIYSDPQGIQYAYRCIRTVITNDSTLSLHVNIDLPANFTSMSPSEARKFKAFILPDSMTSGKQYNEANNGWTSTVLKSYLDKELNKASSFRKIILPKEKYELKIGFLFLPTDGVTRIELLTKGHKHNLRIPTIAPDMNMEANKLALMLGATYNSSYSLINCGQFFY